MRWAYAVVGVTNGLPGLGNPRGERFVASPRGNVFASPSARAVHGPVRAEGVRGRLARPRERSEGVVGEWVNARSCWAG